MIFPSEKISAISFSIFGLLNVGTCGITKTSFTEVWVCRYCALIRSTTSVFNLCVGNARAALYLVVASS